MNKIAMRIIFSSVFFLITGGCDSSRRPVVNPIEAEIIKKYNLHPIGQPKMMKITLPQQLSDANWGLKEIVCRQAGYQLTPFAGQTLTLIKQDIKEKYRPSGRLLSKILGEPLCLWVLAKDKTPVCGYLTVRDGSRLIPGIFPLKRP